MEEMKKLLDNNRSWAQNCLAIDPEFFQKRAKEQKPRYLWIGCSDSRVPANVVVGLDPGELFVHRNIANLFSPEDPNCLAVLQFAVEALGVEHVIVCGHYGCGGMEPTSLQHVRDWTDRIPHEKDPKKRVELNVKQQVKNIVNTEIVRNTLNAGKKLLVHGWVYDLTTGLISDLKVM